MDDFFLEDIEDKYKQLNFLTSKYEKVGAKCLNKKYYLVFLIKNRPIGVYSDGEWVVFTGSKTQEKVTHYKFLEFLERFFSDMYMRMENPHLFKKG